MKVNNYEQMLLNAILNKDSNRVLNILIESKDKININNIDLMLNSTPLYMASFLGLPEILSIILLQCNDVDVNVKCTYGNTALTIASKMGHYDCVKTLLLDKNIDRECRNNDGHNALDLAFLHKHIKIVELLSL